MNMQINTLPTKTWNHLNMNGTQVNLEGKFEKNIPQAEGLCRPGLWLEEGPDSCREIGAELAPIVQELPVSTLKTPEGEKMEKPLVLHYTFSQEKKVQEIFCFVQEPTACSVQLWCCSPGNMSKALWKSGFRLPGMPG